MIVITAIFEKRFHLKEQGFVFRAINFSKYCALMSFYRAFYDPLRIFLIYLSNPLKREMKFYLGHTFG